MSVARRPVYECPLCRDQGEVTHRWGPLVWAEDCVCSGVFAPRRESRRTRRIMVCAGFFVCLGLSVAMVAALAGAFQK